jgi:predicted Na+-dependent transporter
LSVPLPLPYEWREALIYLMMLMMFVSFIRLRPDWRRAWGPEIPAYGALGLILAPLLTYLVARPLLAGLPGGRDYLAGLILLAATPTGAMATIYMPYIRGVRAERIVALIVLYTPLATLAMPLIFTLYCRSDAGGALNGGAAIDWGALAWLTGRAALLVLVPLGLAGLLRRLAPAATERASPVAGYLQPPVLAAILWISFSIALHGPNGLLVENGPGWAVALRFFLLAGGIFVGTTLLALGVGRLLPGAEPRTLALSQASRNIQLPLAVAAMLTAGGGVSDRVFLPLLLAIPWHHLSCLGLGVIFPVRKTEPAAGLPIPPK